jgi:hypothetical protein
VTVEASGLEEALRIGLSFVRSAIHATGAGTHGWDDTGRVENAIVIYEVDTDESVEVRPLVSA